MEYSPTGDLGDSPRVGEGGPRPEAGVREAQPTRLRSDHVLGACLRLSLHLWAARKQEPPGVSRPARPRRRSPGSPFLPPLPSTGQQSTLSAGGPCGPVAPLQGLQG